MKLKKVITSKYFFPVLLIILSCVCIFYQYLLIPKNLAFDEVEFAKLALSLKNHQYAVYSPLATGHSTLYFYILLFSFQIFGITNFALRFPAALCGIASVILFYFILKNIFLSLNKLHAPLLSFLLSVALLTSHWFLNFARFGFEATFLLFLELSAIACLLYYFVNKKNSFFIASAVFTGLAFHSYYPGRIFFVIPFALLFIHKTQVKKIFQYGLIFLIVISPLALYLIFHQDIRISQQLYLTNPHIDVAQKANYFFQNLSKIMLMFHVQGDLNGRHNYPGKPALNLFLGLLFIAGLFLSAKNWRSKYNTMFLLYFLISLTPSLLTYPSENPHMLRTVTSLIPIMYFIGISVIFILKTRPVSQHKLIMMSAVILLFLSSGYELRTYFIYQSKVFPKAFEVKKSLPKALR